MPSTVYCQSPSVLLRQVAREVFITRVDDGAVHSLAGPAYDAWQLLERPQSAEQLVASLADSYQVDGERIQRDVEGLLQDLVQRQWVMSLERV